MSELITLPMKATSNRAAVPAIVMLLIGPFLTTGALFYALQIGDTGLSDQMKYFLPLGLFVFTAVSNFFFIKSLKPRNLVLNAVNIEMAPISVLGISTTIPETRNLTEFKSLDYVKETGSKGGISRRLYLRNALDIKNKDISIDIPSGVDKHQFVSQLGAALKLKVNDNA